MFLYNGSVTEVVVYFKDNIMFAFVWILFDRYCELRLMRIL